MLIHAPCLIRAYEIETNFTIEGEAEYTVALNLSYFYLTFREAGRTTTIKSVLDKQLEMKYRNESNVLYQHWVFDETLPTHGYLYNGNSQMTLDVFCNELEINYNHTKGELFLDYTTMLGKKAVAHRMLEINWTT